MNELKEKAWAKLNISLDVLARRADGYHDLAMVMQTVSLRDEVTVRFTEGEAVRAVTSMGFIPGDERNLAVKAAKAFFAEAALPVRGMEIEILCREVRREARPRPRNRRKDRFPAGRSAPETTRIG